MVEGPGKSFEYTPNFFPCKKYLFPISDVSVLEGIRRAPGLDHGQDFRR